MSYCRWSSDNWLSDVYAYESARGFEVHLATNRYVGEIPPLLPWSEENPDAWFRRYQEQMAVVTRLPKEPIGGPFDGQTFVYATLDEFYDGLLDIMKEGYHVPDFVFDMLEDEIATAVTGDSSDG